MVHRERADAIVKHLLGRHGPASPLRRLVTRRATRPDPFAHPVAIGLTAALLAVGAAAWVASQRRGGHNGGGRRPAPRARGLRVDRAMTVARPAMELYRVWRDLGRLPEFMSHLESVVTLSETRSRWTARGPGGVTVEWEAEIVTDQPGQLIAWRSVSGDVDNAGSVRFTEAPAQRGTEIAVQLRYAPPAGQLGAAVATVFGQGADRQVREDLRRFKQMMETGEIADAGLTASGRSR
jgi:uncharacterized membrane protein